ncbi:RagB/SusD family nutrient uptake outer membrane protein [Zunongwangia sp. SCSIO 43204]|nr:RagB/SusD family nutrient uptake outer membrane protein [Zunongwangia sp. SCSIO 43204]|tara:strand:+ start:15288 stop:16889 length:1602 start_codon:yes stop_codon:yes gene_type:complete
MKITTKLITRLSILGFLITFIGCTGELDVEPGDPNAFLAEDFYSDAQSYREGLAGVYANLSLTGTNGADNSNIAGLDAGTSQYGRGLWNLQELSTDEAIWSWENDPGLRELNRNTWTSENVVLRGMFGRTMTSVAFANEYLRQTSPEVLETRGVENQLKEQIETYRAEARFLRALAYYHMMELFGKAPYLTENDPVGAYQAPMYGRTELFNYIESELLEVVPAMEDPLQNEYARADKAAAWMVLAKIYLNSEVYTGEERYSDCLKYCNNIIESPYTLAPNYLTLFMADNDRSEARNEIIFPFISDGITTQNYGPTTVVINGQVGSIESNASDFGVNPGWNGAIRVSQEFSETMLNGSYNNDTRNTLITEERSINIPSISQRNTGYIIAKWSNLTSTGEAGSALEIVDTDFPLFRLGDVYLMYAEAHLRGGGGNLQNAVAYVNELRARADNPLRISPSELTLDFLIEERMVELYWEGHRRQDLIRFSQYSGGTYNWSWKGNAPKGIAIGDYRKLYPIPSASLAANPNLTQNPGY